MHAEQYQEHSGDCKQESQEKYYSSTHNYGAADVCKAIQVVVNECMHAMKQCLNHQRVPKSSTSDLDPYKRNLCIPVPSDIFLLTSKIRKPDLDRYNNSNNFLGTRL